MIHFTRSKGSKLHFKYFGIFLSRFYPHKRVPTYRNRHTRSIQIPGIVRYIYISVEKRIAPTVKKGASMPTKSRASRFGPIKRSGEREYFFLAANAPRAWRIQKTIQISNRLWDSRFDVACLAVKLAARSECAKNYFSSGLREAGRLVWWWRCGFVVKINRTST